MTAVEDTEDSKEDLRVDSDGGSSSSSRQESPNTPRILSPAKAKEMEEFRKQLLIKREARRKIIAERSREMQKLKQQLEEEKRAREEVIDENTRLRALIAQNSSASVGEPLPERNDDIRTSLENLEIQIQEMRDQNKCIRCELAECNLTHQSVVEELALVNKENIELRKHVDSLKEVNKVSKDMLSIRESQLNQVNICVFWDRSIYLCALRVTCFLIYWKVDRFYESVYCTTRFPFENKEYSVYFYYFSSKKNCWKLKNH